MSSCTFHHTKHSLYRTLDSRVTQIVNHGADLAFLPDSLLDAVEVKVAYPRDRASRDISSFCIPTLCCPSDIGVHSGAKTSRMEQNNGDQDTADLSHAETPGRFAV